VKTKILFPLKPKISSCDDFYVADTETGTEYNMEKSKLGHVIKWQLEATQKKFIFGAVYGKNYTKVFHSLKEMQDEFKERRYKNKTVFFHNFGKYDSSVLFDSIFDLDNESIFIGSRFISCTNGVCTFADSLNIYKASVKEIGKKLGLEKLGMNDGNYKRSLWPRDKARDINGCVRDCQIIYDALLDIFEKCGDIKLTIGSLAMTYYRRFAMPYWIESNENTKHFWKSYYGGRTEAFKLGNVHAQVIDVNSLYPDRMKETVFPNPKFIKYESQPDRKYFEKLLKEYEGCAQIDVFHPEFFIGLLPCRHLGKLMFLNGSFSGCYNFNEIRFALRYGVEIKKIHWCCHSERMPSPFEKFVDILAEEKFLANAQGRSLDEWVAKYLMNNLYGKFGQRIDEKSIYIKDVVEQYDLIAEHQRKGTFIKLLAFNSERCDGFLIVKELKNKDPKYSIPSFSSYITSAGRVKLCEQLIKMQHQKPVYCDTDSIAFSIGDYNESSMRLGEWKLENKIITQIRGPKDYDYYNLEKNTSHTRTKGIPTKATQLTENSFEFVSLVGQKEGLRRGLDIGIPLKRVKELRRNYDKRVVLNDGETKPIFI